MAQVEPYVARRFLLKGSLNFRPSPMTLFAWLAISVGIASIVCLLSVMYGFERALRDRFLNAYPHILITPDPAKLMGDFSQWDTLIGKIPNVTRVVPYLEAEMIAQHKQKATGMVAWGCPNANLDRIRGKGLIGKIPSASSKIPQIVVGSELAERLGIEKGSQLTLISPLQQSGAFGLVPRNRTYEVSGIYSSGHYEFDQQYVFLLIEDLKDLLQSKKDISGWQIWMSDEGYVADGVRAISKVVPKSWEVQSWEKFNSALFHSLKLEQFGMALVLGIAILIAMMNVVITLLMHVSQKRKAIGILKAMGASSGQVQKIFVWQGMYLGLSGILTGGILSFLFVIYVRYFSSFRLPEIYYDRTIPVEIRPLSVFIIFACAFALVFFSTIYPARRAAALDPLETLRE